MKENPTVTTPNEDGFTEEERPCSQDRGSGFEHGGGQGSHRFLRRGHWRHQWYGPRDARRQEWIWIHQSLVNGPRNALIR
jgi:hypothetical protein